MNCEIWHNHQKIAQNVSAMLECQSVPPSYHNDVICQIIEYNHTDPRTLKLIFWNHLSIYSTWLKSFIFLVENINFKRNTENLENVFLNLWNLVKIHCLKTVGSKTFEMLYIELLLVSLDRCLFHCKLYQVKRIDILKTNRLLVFIINLTNPVACPLSDFVEHWNHHYGTVILLHPHFFFFFLYWCVWLKCLAFLHVTPRNWNSY